MEWSFMGNDNPPSPFAEAAAAAAADPEATDPADIDPLFRFPLERRL
jgi:hypothetical protein